jgi:hypothetical protein
MGQWETAITSIISSVSSLVGGIISADKQADADKAERQDALRAQHAQHVHEEELAKIAVQAEHEETAQEAAKQHTMTRLIVIGGGVLLVGLGVMYLTRGDDKAVTKKVGGKE